MSLFSGLFARKKQIESVVLIDISADSVAGAYAYAVEGELPVVLYTQRLPIETHAGEARARAMLRALKVLGETLIREGAPALARATGSGSAGSILVSVNAPWQKTSVRTENLEQITPFTFSKSLVAAALKRIRAAPPEQVLVDESIIGTILNGYETRDPYGKQARRASILVLASLVDEGVARGIQAALRGLYHTKNILSISGCSLRYQAMRAAFPHEHDALILDATGLMTSMALVRDALFVAIVDRGDAATARDSWAGGITKELAELAKRYPLPRTIFLLARETDIPSLSQTLGTIPFGKLWLSDNPPKVVPVIANHLIGLVRQTTEDAPDIALLLMALYWHRHPPGETA